MLPEKSTFVRRSKVKSTVSSTSNKGPWMKKYPMVMNELYQFVLLNWYNGDRLRLSQHVGLYKDDSKRKLRCWMETTHPEVIEFYERTFDRRLTGHHIADRLRFMFRRYTNKGVFLGRSNEYPNIP